MDVPTPLDLRPLIAATTAAGAARSVSTANAVDALLGLVAPGGDGQIRMIFNEIQAKNRERAEKKEVGDGSEPRTWSAHRSGPVVGDAIRLRLPFVPPFIGQGGTLEEMVHGVNFAYATAGIIFSSGSDLELVEPAAETLVNLSQK